MRRVSRPRPRPEKPTPTAWLQSDSESDTEDEAEDEAEDQGKKTTRLLRRGSQFQGQGPSVTGGEEEDKDQKAGGDGGDHHPRQSVVYFKHKKAINNARDTFGYTLLASFALLFLFSTWISLEEGKFPFNIDVFADVAYNRKKWGTPVAALVAGFVGAILVWMVQRKILVNSTTAVHGQVEKQLLQQGRMRVIKPKKPWALKQRHQHQHEQQPP